METTYMVRAIKQNMPLELELCYAIRRPTLLVAVYYSARR